MESNQKQLLTEVKCFAIIKLSRCSESVDTFYLIRLGHLIYIKWLNLIKNVCIKYDYLQWIYDIY